MPSGRATGDRGRPDAAPRRFLSRRSLGPGQQPRCGSRRYVATQGWCDDPASPRYNRPVRLPASDGHEAMWRQDGLYDIVVVLGYNLAPRRRGAGSAIFLHCAKPDFPPTLGCIALAKADLRRLLPRLSKRTVLITKL